MGSSEFDALIASEEKNYEVIGQGVTPILDTMIYKKHIFKSREDLLKQTNQKMLHNAPRIDLIDSYQVPLRSAASGSAPNLSKRSYSVTDDEISVLTPVDMGRQELYEIIPFSATSGLQRKQKGLSRAFAYYMSGLSLVEQEHGMREPISEKDRELNSSYTSLLLLDELDMDQALLTKPLILATVVACISQFLVGYNTGVMNSPEKNVFEYHGANVWAVAVSAFAVGAPFGAGLGGNLADSLGRRRALLLETWLFLLGGLIQTCALDMYSIIVGRVIIGVASGLVSVLVPIYLGELAPPTLRGALGTLTQFSFVIGVLSSYLIALPCASLWRVMFAVTPFMCVIQLAAFSFLVESPMWLLGRDHKSKRARFIIKKLRGCQHDHEVETEVKLYISAGKAQSFEEHSNKQSVLLEMLNNDKLRFLLTSSLILQISQQFCGINAVFYYSTLFLESYKGLADNSLISTATIGAINVIATMFAVILMDIYGRRTLILWSSGGMFLSCVFIVLSLLGYFSNSITLLAINAYVFFFAIGLGPIPWLIIAEMFDAKYVPTAMSVAFQLNWACNFAVGLAFPYMIKHLQEFSFGPFAVVLLLTFFFAMCYLPETQGSTPEELMETLVKKNSSKVYHNLNKEEPYASTMDIEWRMAMEQVKEEE
eukprot:CAMPEP_0194366980 /NCGR_PEP_ID=MMETSP0174-20130528/15108_1 /TAXON_ID=216777 /ORGANISM="Proboscia alata, Strain PI-D3" /LENGTH=653 /DNA_ID=CAMNT_0039142523 /DNA_START=90 /DNA_END=2051 /DNA_ORIENTATION=+